MEISLGGPAAAPAAPPAKARREPAPPAPTVLPSPLKVRLVPPVSVEVTTIPITLAKPSADLQFENTDLPATTPVVVVAATSLGGGEPCEILASLQQVLQLDPGVRRALLRIPIANRSVANAVMLWDRGWVTGALIGGDDALEPIRTAIRKAVETAAPNCRSETVVGPRLLSVQGPDGTTVLAVGSGQWRWADLLDERLFSDAEAARR